ncbi:DUF6345 domain-containing protein [Amycolatopsis australiensis]|uniref:Uncharacterized protein n=1 Tax=Amycolatopsis australiensis TaxID=546364 RepID=A0A1K1SKP9_9PSEU|nr:DUF6345 domain-containing protein [Amycolatopsis australiensis]SFW84756.1 hypothetical protein SAMN04489730_5947 [Amycolatopsis australiensis]
MALLKNGAVAAPPGTPAAARALTSRDPFGTTGLRADRGANRYGVCSIEDFPPGITDLSATHEDAGGFYNYVNQFTAPNFWYRDGGVLSWIYGEEYDDWQGTYGFDACVAEYHSGHGTMDAGGVFRMPMGGTWGGSAWTSSAEMRLGNEVARYLFFSTCLSLRIGDGNSPIRTWDAANLGLRMIFGFETTSVDSPNYGAFFFGKWNGNGHKFSKAWLDASWDIDHHQAPSVVACGATQAEAQDRLFNEGTFDPAAASKNWWWWTWYDAARSISTPRLELPGTPRTARFAPQRLSSARLTELAGHFGVRLDGPVAATAGPHGLVLGDGQGGPRLSVDPRGVREITFAEPDGTGRDAPSAAEAVRIAQDAVETFGLADRVDLVADKVRHQYHAGGTADEVADPRVRETHVVFTQLVDGHPVVTPGLGEVRVSIDGAGTVTTIVDATREVERLAESAPAAPADSRATARASTVDEALDAPLQRLLRRLSAGGRVPAEVRTIPDSTAVGYALRGDDGAQVIRRTVEVDCGAGLAKRYVLEAPLH